MILMKLDTIEGDCQIQGYEKWIVVDSLSWEIQREEKESGKAGTTDVNLGVADLPAITVAKSMDNASIYLMQNAIAGGAFANPCEIHLVETAGVDQKLHPYLSFKLNRPIIKSWSIDASDDDRPSENVSIMYNKIVMEYWQTPDGKAFTSVGKRGWDTVTNKAWNG